jgi:hypothetical protein
MSKLSSEMCGLLFEMAPRSMGRKPCRDLGLLLPTANPRILGILRYNLWRRPHMVEFIRFLILDELKQQNPLTSTGSLAPDYFIVRGSDRIRLQSEPSRQRWNETRPIYWCQISDSIRSQWEYAWQRLVHESHTFPSRPNSTQKPEHILRHRTAYINEYSPAKVEYWSP